MISIGLRFISCGLVSLTIGLLWRLTLAPKQIGIGSALGGIAFLLLGFISTGLLWYWRDHRLRRRKSDKLSDEQIFFSFIVFAVIPLAVLLLIAMVWLLSLIVS